MNVFYGKKVILFDLVKDDLEHFVKLHRDDTKGHLQAMSLHKMTEEEALEYTKAMILTNQIKVFSVMTKEGKASRRIGFIYLGNMTSFSCAVSGIMDNSIAKGLMRQLRKGKYTYSEDSFNTIIKNCFNKGYRRIETSALVSNRRGVALIKKVGFKEEGRARKACRLDEDKFVDILRFGLLKEDKEEKEEQMLNKQ